MEPEIQHAHILHYQVPEISIAQWNIYKVIGGGVWKNSFLHLAELPLWASEFTSHFGNSFIITTITNWMLFKNLASKLSAVVLGDYTIQGAEIAGANCNYSWPIKE